MNHKLFFLIPILAFLLTGCGQTEASTSETQPVQIQIPETLPAAVAVGGNIYDADTVRLTLTDAAGLREAIPNLPCLESVHLIQPTLPAQELLALVDAFPEISFSWELEVLGTTYPDTVSEIDLSGIPLSGVEDLDVLMAYFPKLEKLILCDCGLSNETLAAYRDQVREQYKVVWSVQIKTLTIRTDETTFMPVKHDVFIFDDHTPDLIYCEDMIAVDVGHMPIHNIDFVRGMPKLQYLIVADTLIRDISPIADHKELIYLEIFKLNIEDYTPLLSCTALQDLNLAQTAGDPAVLAQMPWLKNLWMVQCSVSDENRLLLTESLPDTRIEFDLGWTQGDNWRTLENYFKMRQLLEMAPNVWW